MWSPFRRKKRAEVEGDQAAAVTPAAPGRERQLLPAWEPGAVVLGRYQVESVLEGGMGRVAIARHLGWGVRMAIKSPRPEVLADREGVERILKEAHAWVQMGMHPHVAYCYYVLTIGGAPCLFIEYVDGGSLADWIKAGRCGDLRTNLSLAIQFCHGMEHTHSQGIIHRDIKPANILITKDALLKITDFGMLRLVSDRTTAAGLGGAVEAGDDAETTKGFRGTPGYASPEQWRDTHQVDGRTDIYSFGLCLWMMFCGRKPFANSRQELPIPEPVGAGRLAIPPALAAILKRCIAFAPEARYPDFAALRLDLNAVYLEAFRVPCPYNRLDWLDLRADTLNNRGV
ncbi:MAG: serine/threonine-protein kinase, partial [Thermodesulfobacteriota bacterium]